MRKLENIDLATGCWVIQRSRMREALDDIVELYRSDRGRELLASARYKEYVQDFERLIAEEGGK